VGLAWPTSMVPMDSAIVYICTVDLDPLPIFRMDPTTPTLGSPGPMDPWIHGSMRWGGTWVRGWRDGVGGGDR